MIDEALFGAFVRELEALRTHGAQFAELHPDVASALDIGARKSRDGGVERIVQSTAFLAARLRLFIDANAAELPATMLATLAPILSEPVPSMAIAAFEDGHEARPIPRGTQLDYYHGSERALTFRTTMDAEPTPLRVSTRRVAAGPGAGDALAVRLEGSIPSKLTLYLGRDSVTAATLLDALARALVRIEVRPRGARTSTPVRLATRTLRRRGFAPAERALPERAGGHRSYRLMTEFLNFPEKFRFVTLELPALASGSEVVLQMAHRVAIEDDDLGDAFNANRVPVINLWEASGTPFDLNGRMLEYPARVDARRHAAVECHSVESVELFEAAGGGGTRIDPIIAPARRSKSKIQWGVRRGYARSGRRCGSTSEDSTTSSWGAAPSWRPRRCWQATGSTRRARAREAHSSRRRASETGGCGCARCRPCTAARCPRTRRRARCAST